MYLLSSTEIPDSSQQNYVRMTTNSQIKYQNLQTKHTARRSFQNRVDTLYLNPSTGSSLLSGKGRVFYIHLVKRMFTYHLNTDSGSIDF